MSNRIDFRQFVVFLKSQIRQKATDSLLMVTDDNHTIWIGLRDGMIEALYFGPKKGMEALNRIRKVSGGTLKRAKSLNFPATPGLPSTEEIIRELEQAVAAVQPAAPVAPTASVQQDSEPVSEYVSPSPAGVNTVRIGRIMDKLQTLLQEQLGPIASALIPRLVKRMGGINSETALQRLVEELVREVEGIGDHEAFRQEAMQLLKS